MTDTLPQSNSDLETKFVDAKAFLLQSSTKSGDNV